MALLWLEQAERGPAVFTQEASGAESRLSAKLTARVSQFGDLDYPLGFPQFDYVNASSRGGSVRKSVMDTFDNFNMVPRV